MDEGGGGGGGGQGQPWGEGQPNLVEGCLNAGPRAGVREILFQINMLTMEKHCQRQDRVKRQYLAVFKSCFSW